MVDFVESMALFQVLFQLEDVQAGRAYLVQHGCFKAEILLAVEAAEAAEAAEAEAVVVAAEATQVLEVAEFTVFPEFVEEHCQVELLRAKS